MAQITVELDKESEPSQTVMVYRPLGEPNAESIAAMDELDRGEVESFTSVEAFMASLNAPVFS
ncbi:MAG: hypothetical protein QM523_04530 [Candidatus Pacebacteria bacterium]|nr:hypothetical protein [Candidatus Paceibacterota bacterium]